MMKPPGPGRERATMSSDAKRILITSHLTLDLGHLKSCVANALWIVLTGNSSGWQFACKARVTVSQELRNQKGRDETVLASL